MSFLEHLDELRRRLVNSVIIIVIFFMACWFVSDRIYNFLSVPIRKALSEASRRDLPVSGVTGNEKVLAIDNLKENDEGRYIFDDTFKIGPTVAATYAYVNPVVALLLGWLVAGEEVGPRTLLAAAIIVASVVLITSDTFRKR